MEKVKKKHMGLKILLVVGALLLILVLVAIALYLYADNKADIVKGYNREIEIGGALEAKYLQDGPYAAKKATAKAEDPIRKYTIYYPEELESADRTYPLLLVVNGTGGKATKYEPEFALYASWGFIAVGTQDKGTGTGQTTVTTLRYMLEQNENPDSLFYHRIDVENIGITGFSQGGAAVFNVLTKYEEARYFKAAAPLSPVSEHTAEQTTNYPYDSADVRCPIMILAGTSGEFETEIVIPIADLNEQYEKITAPKVMARRIGMNHDHMMYAAGGYVIAWFRWQLMGDMEAAQVFLGDAPELLTNALYQDQRIDLQVEP